MKTFLSLCITDFFKMMLKNIFTHIIYSLVPALIFLFIGRVVFEDKTPFLIYWKWSYLLLLTIEVVGFIKKAVNSWSLFKELSLKWNTTIKVVYIALIRNKLYKNYKVKEMLEWSPQDFKLRSNISTMVSNIFK